MIVLLLKFNKKHNSVTNLSFLVVRSVHTSKELDLMLEYIHLRYLKLGWQKVITIQAGLNEVY